MLFQTLYVTCAHFWRK